MTSENRLQLPAEVPLMVLPGCVLFPSALMPLRIFEPRYRQMLNWALEHDRMFCIAMMKPGVTEAETVGHFHHTAGLGLVRASVTQSDGTSNLMLQGFARVRFTGFTQASPFRVARVEAQPDIPATGRTAARIADKVRALASRFQVPEDLDSKLGERLEELRDGGALADFVAGAFVRDPGARQALLEEPDALARLRTVARLLEEELGA